MNVMVQHIHTCRGGFPTYNVHARGCMCTSEAVLKSQMTTVKAINGNHESFQYGGCKAVFHFIVGVSSLLWSKTPTLIEDLFHLMSVFCYFVPSELSSLVWIDGRPRKCWFISGLVWLPLGKTQWWWLTTATETRVPHTSKWGKWPLSPQKLESPCNASVAFCLACRRSRFWLFWQNGVDLARVCLLWVLFCFMNSLKCCCVQGGCAF